MEKNPETKCFLKITFEQREIKPQQKHMVCFCFKSVVGQSDPYVI